MWKTSHRHYFYWFGICMCGVAMANPLLGCQSSFDLLWSNYFYCHWIIIIVCQTTKEKIIGELSKPRLGLHCFDSAQRLLNRENTFTNNGHVFAKQVDVVRKVDDELTFKPEKLICHFESVDNSFNSERRYNGFVRYTLNPFNVPMNCVPNRKPTILIQMSCLYRYFPK